MKRDRFAKKVLGAIRREYPDAEYDPEQFSIQYSENAIFNLGNFYEQYAAAGFLERRKVFRHWLEALSDTRQGIPDSIGEAAPNLLISVRDLSFVSMGQLTGRAHGIDDAPKIVTEPVAADVVACIAFDTERAIALVTQTTVDDWGKSVGELLELAAGNLSARSSQDFSSPMEGLFLSPWQDNYDAARLLLTDRIRRLPIRGDVLAMVPDRDLLAIADSAQPEAVAAMVAIAAERLENEGYTISAALLRMDGDSWVEATPDDEELSGQLQLIRTMKAANDAAHQKETLEAIYEREERDVFVASVMAVESEEGPVGERLKTFCTWTKDVPTMVPTTTLVGLFDPDLGDDPEPILVPLDDLLALLGDGQMVPQGLYPERYYVEEFPTGDTLLAIRDMAVPLGGD
jgi:hypothetical protein